MNEQLLLVGLAALPCLGILLGALLSEVFDLSRPLLGLTLHFAEGAMLAVVGVELMPRALGVRPPWVVVVAFLAGGGTFLLIERGIQWTQRRRKRSGSDSGPWMIYMGTVIDYLTDGIMIGAGVTIAAQLGLGLGQAVTDTTYDTP